MNNRYLPFFFCCMIFVSCQGKQNSGEAKQASSNNTNSDETVLILSDSSILKSNLVLTFAHSDSVYYGEPVFINKLQTKLILKNATFLSQADNNQTPYLIYPGEQVKIKKDTGNSLIFFIDGNKQRTNELNFFRLLVQKFGAIYNFLPQLPFHRPVENIDSIHIFQKQINSTLNNRLLFLDSFAKHNLISKNFEEIANGTIRAAAVKDSLLLYWSNRNLLKNLDLYNGLITEKIKTIRNISFQPFIVYFNVCRVIVSMSTTKYLDYELQDSLDVIKRFNFADTAFTGLAKDFLLANTLYTASFKRIPIANKYLQKFYAECTDSTYKRIVENKISEKQTIASLKGNNNLLSADGKTIKNLQDVITNNKGKIIYIDFWASWCAPCRAEMPYSAKLREEYKNKNIVFLYISIDENIGDWKNANEAEALGNKNSFLLLNSGNSTFIRQNKISTIPRYMIIGKDGKIINNDAPRPDDNKLKELIDKLLAE